MRKNTPKRSCSILPKWKKGVKTAAHMYHPSHREYPPRGYMLLGPKSSWPVWNTLKTYQTRTDRFLLGWYVPKVLNSLWSNKATWHLYICQHRFRQWMAWHLLGTKSMPDPMLMHCTLGPEEHISVKFCFKLKENAFKIVCKMSGLDAWHTKLQCTICTTKGLLCKMAIYLLGGRFKNTYELLNLNALKFSPVNKFHIFQCMSKIFCVEFQR